MKNSQKPSRPKELPLLGSGLSFGKDPLKFFEDLNRNHGNVVPYSLLGTPFVAVYHPDDIEHVLVKNASNYIKSVIIRKTWAPFLGQGLISADGATWKRSRKVLQPFMSRDKMAGYFETVLKESLNAAGTINPGEVVDSNKLTMRLMLFTFVKVLFHSDLDEDKIERFGKLFDECSEYFNYTLTPAGMILERFPTPKKKKFLKAVREIDDLIEDVIKADPDPAGNILSALREARDEDGNPFSEELVRDHLKTFFMAGHETSALSLNYTLFLLAQHPEELAKVHEELDSVIGDRKPQFADIEKLKHLKNVLQESLRLYPAVSVLSREAIADDVVGGVTIKKGTNVCIPVPTIHRSPLWYDEPNAFRPDRWKDPQVPVNRNVNIPFGAGPRVCIGASFSMLEMATALAVILRDYDLRLHSAPTIDLVVSITTRPKESILLEFQKRQKKSLQRSA